MQRVPLISFLIVWVAAPGTAHALSRAADKLPPCEPGAVGQAFAEPRQEDDWRVLILGFAGAERDFGRHLESSLRERFPESQKILNEIDDKAPKLSAIKLRHVACTVEDHEQARRIGASAQADLVLWGQPACRTPGSCVHVRVEVAKGTSINSGSSIRNSPGAQINNTLRVQVNAPDSDDEAAKPATAAPPALGRERGCAVRTTLIETHGVENNPDIIFGEANWGKNFHFYPWPDLRELQVADVVSPRSPLLLNFIVGFYALRQNQDAIAHRLLRQATEQVHGGVEQNPHLYSVYAAALISDDKPTEGRQLLEKALNSCAPTDDRCRAVALHNIAWGLTSGEEPRAAEYYERALVLRRQTSDQTGEALTLVSLGWLYAQTFLINAQKAQVYFEQALPLLRSVGDRAYEALVLSSLAELVAERGDNKRARTLYEAALPLHRQLKQTSHERWTRRKLGLVYAALGENQQARAFLEEALRVCQQRKENHFEEYIWNALCGVYLALGDKGKARACTNDPLPQRKR